MKKFIAGILTMMLALACVGQRDDPEPEPGPGPGPDEPVVVPEEGKAYFRRSLVLDFTGTWCVNCPRMEEAIKEAGSQRPGRLVTAAVHCLSVDKMAVMPLSQDLTKRFGVSAWPSVIVDLDASTLMTSSSAELLLSHCDRLLAARPEAAGIKIQSALKDGKLDVSLEATAVREGDYSLHFVILEDGIVAAQTGSTQDHVHDNVLRSWFDSPLFSGIAKDGTISWSASAEASEGQRIAAFVCRGGMVDNVSVCACGKSVPYQYEEDK